VRLATLAHRDSDYADDDRPDESLSDQDLPEQIEVDEAID
jgi:hypothetical protein